MNNSEPYFFVSYIQKNRISDEDLACLGEQSINYWIDWEGMRSTDDIWPDCAQGAVGGIGFALTKSGIDPE